MPMILRRHDLRLRHKPDRDSRYRRNRAGNHVGDIAFRDVGKHHLRAGWIRLHPRRQVGRHPVIGIGKKTSRLDRIDIAKRCRNTSGRFINVNPDDALEKTNKKFIKRFQYLETEAKKIGRELSDMTLAEMDVYWNKAKSL